MSLFWPIVKTAARFPIYSAPRFSSSYKKMKAALLMICPKKLHLDRTSVDRHLLKLVFGNFVTYKVPSLNRRIRKRMVKNTTAEITQQGKVVFEEIIKPIVSVMNDNKQYKRMISRSEPTEADLVKAMKIYKRSLEH